MVTDVYFGNDYRLSIVLGPALATSTPAQMVYWGEGDFPVYLFLKKLNLAHFAVAGNGLGHRGPVPATMP